MDYDSSTKFISSLAKFLQSLCNGYVEFDNGVEVIGHIYLSVDTGKKIDYILNEKVCKTDENSVTFISNSFHAQPAEKPKPTSRKAKPEIEPPKSQDDVVEIEPDNNSQIEPKSTNYGTVPRVANRNVNSPSQRQGKRPSSPSKSGRHSPNLKRSKVESHDQSHISDNGISPSPVSDLSRVADVQSVDLQGAEGPSLATDYSDSYQHSFNQAEDDNTVEESEERDIKPNIDTDVTFVKEEFAPSQLGEGSEERNQVDDASLYSQMYHQNYSGASGYSNQSYGMPTSSKFPFGVGERSDMYDSGQGPSVHMEGDGTDPSVVSQQDYPAWRLSQPQSDRRVDPLSALAGSMAGRKWRPSKCTGTKLYGKNYGQMRSCRKCHFTSRDSFDMSVHRKKCNGKRHLTCSLCSKVLSRYDALAEHMRGIHGIGNKVNCRFCGKCFKYKPQVYQHQLVCPSRPFKVDPLPVGSSPPPPHYTSSSSNITAVSDVESINYLQQVLPAPSPSEILSSSLPFDTIAANQVEIDKISFPYDVKYSHTADFNNVQSSNF